MAIFDNFRSASMLTVLITASTLALNLPTMADPGKAGMPEAARRSAALVHVTTAPQSALADTVSVIDAALTGYRQSFGGYQWDAATGSLEVLLTEDADPRAVAAVKNRVDATARVVFGTAPRAYDEVNASAQHLFETRMQWAADPDAVFGSYAEEANGTVVLDVRADQVDQIRSLITDPAVRVDAAASPPRPEAGTRRADAGWWTAGNALQKDLQAAPAGDAYCTQGFTWRLWGTSGRYGGIAEHCVAGTWTTWYHNRRTVGTVVRTSPASDSALIAPVANASFSPTVWVGGRTTGDERPVKGIGVAIRGQQVALSGANSGLTVDTVYDESYNSEYGPVVIMTGNHSVGGDSGGPWLTTRSGSGDAVAYGQHFGDFFVAGVYRSTYIPVNNTSARLSASIVLAP